MTGGTPTRRALARTAAALLAGAAAGSLAGCAAPGGRVAAGPAGAARARGEQVPLPPPDLTGRLPLETLLARRRSVREFTRRPLDPAQLGQLLWAAQGTTSPGGFRTAPSAGALFPLELYAAARTADPAAPQAWHYLPDGHRVERWRPVEGWDALTASTPSRGAVAGAGAVVVVAGVVRRTAVKYGGRSREYVDLEAGHAVQNLLLQAVALGLGAVPIGAYDPDRLERWFGLPSRESVHYLVAVGWPA